MSDPKTSSPWPVKERKTMLFPLRTVVSITSLEAGENERWSIGKRQQRRLRVKAKKRAKRGEMRTQDQIVSVSPPNEIDAGQGEAVEEESGNDERGRTVGSPARIPRVLDKFLITVSLPFRSTGPRHHIVWSQRSISSRLVGSAMTGSRRRPMSPKSPTHITSISLSPNSGNWYVFLTNRISFPISR